MHQTKHFTFQSYRCILHTWYPINHVAIKSAFNSGTWTPVLGIKYIFAVMGVPAFCIRLRLCLWHPVCAALWYRTNPLDKKCNVPTSYFPFWIKENRFCTVRAPSLAHCIHGMPTENTCIQLYLDILLDLEKKNQRTVCSQSCITLCFLLWIIKNRSCW